MYKVIILLAFCCCFVGHIQAVRLTVSGRDLVYDNKKVFLSGANIAWKSYGYDFGNGQYASSRGKLEAWLQQIGASGGNSVRIWVHVEGENTPAYDANGFVTGLDGSNTMLKDLRDFLDAAKLQNILVVFCLFNGAVLKNQKTINLFWDESKLQTYIDKALKPMAKDLAGHPALAAWEIMNEPEGIVQNNQADSSNPCFDTTILANTGAGFPENAGRYIPMKNLLKFVNWLSNAIKEVDGNALVTVGSWSEHAQSNSGDSRNYYTDACLRAAGNKPGGTIDFYQMHTYANGGAWGTRAPFKMLASSYSLDKPLVIGEFAKACSEGESIQTLFQYGYDKGYAGAWSWQYNGEGGCSDDQTTQNNGMGALKGQNGAGGLVNFPVH